MINCGKPNAINLPQNHYFFMGGIETIQVKMVGLVVAFTTLFDSMEFNHHYSAYCLKCQLDLNGT